MADSGALRSKRSRAHLAGDHFLCRHGPPAARAAVVASLAYGDDPVDPRAALERQARRLEGACEGSPGNAALERELRMTLAALAGEDPDAGFDCG